MGKPTSEELMQSPIPVPEWWKTRPADIERQIRGGVSRGSAHAIATSPGGHEVFAVSYGQFESEFRGTANFNSAVGAHSPESYFRRGPGTRKRPVLAVLAGVHGQEFGGMALAMSLIRIMETGRDLAGETQDDLRKLLDSLRLVVIPLANPDGRERVPYEGWCGLPVDEMTKWGQGTRTNGELYRWLGCKKVHPMTGDVGLLGGYFDDNGVNMAHDEWAAPMSRTTTAVLKLTATEGPDLMLNLHGHQNKAMLILTEYVPDVHTRKLQRLSEYYGARMDGFGYPYRSPIHSGAHAASDAVPHAFNLTSMLYHVGADLCSTFEAPQGFRATEREYGYEDLLALHHALIGASAEYLLDYYRG